MKPFKFFSGLYYRTRFVPVLTWDTNTTYHIPLEIYGNVLTIGIDSYNLYRNLREDFPINNYTVVNEMNVGVMYQYRLKKVEEITANHVRIYYQVRFPDSEYYCNFKTTERIR